MIFEIYNAYNMMIMSQVTRKTTICMRNYEGEDSLAVTAKLISAFVFDLRIVHFPLLPKYKMYKL